MKKNTKKRKILIPAALFGLPVSLSNMLELQSSMARGTAPNNPNNLMIKNNPANTNIGNISEIALAIPGAINTLTSPFLTSTATTGGEATMQSLTGIAEGAGSGAQLGMTIGGPVGGLVGGIAGAAVGLIGKKGKAAEMTSFTDFDEGTLGTGLRGAFRNKKLRRRRAAIRLNAFQNREAVAGTERLANEFNEDNTEFDTDVFEYGGKVPSSLAYVDDGELIQTPDGSVSKVPEQGLPTDSNLVNLPEGSRILSNTLKVPGTNKTFAELGDKVMTRKKSKGKDIYALNANMLNEMNNKLMHDKLFTMQESIKAKKGIKNKTKELESFARGGDNTPAGYNAAGFMIDPRFAGEISMGVSAPTPRVRDTWGIKGDVTAPWDNYGRVSEVNAGTLPEVTITAPKRTKFSSSLTISKKATPRVAKSVVAPEIMSDLNTIDEIVPEVSATPQDIRTRSIMPTIGTNPTTVNTPEVNSPNWVDAISDFATLAPIMSNLFTGNPESVLANYNPYASAIANTMGRRRYNINPLLRDIEQNRDVANYSASQQMTNTGHNMAFRLQNAIQANKAKATARATESNVNNQYKGEYANAMNDLGKQRVNATNLASDLNALNRASARNIRRAGLSQLSQFAQNKSLIRNQSKRDKAMLELYKPFLQAGFTSDTIKNWSKYLR
ncbi:hypothetical protein OJM17_gp067 [uncultured phage cr23_1]|uniref:hypothetical protein n=1 Tax=uncultured phage cr23_1 TaxID=2986419 RepID=UPI001C771331|nr:hypothetical protein OJM17_gp067 [uncultured phage cr23_1]